MILNKYSRLFLRVLGATFLVVHFFLYDRLTVLTDDQMWEVAKNTMNRKGYTQYQPVLLSSFQRSELIGSIMYEYKIKMGQYTKMEVEVDRKWLFDVFTIE